jgi:hypothetical protein
VCAPPSYPSVGLYGLTEVAERCEEVGCGRLQACLCSMGDGGGVYALLLQLLKYCSENLVGGLCMFFIEVVVIGNFFVDVKSFYCVKVDPFSV